MYKSRIKKTAGSLTVAVDSQNGELLSLVDENSGDNLIKNSSYTLPNPFALTIGGLTLTAPSNTEIKKTPALAPELREGASSITIVYPMLTDGVRFFDITVTVEIRCLPSSRLEFSIDVQNRQLQPHRRMPLPLHQRRVPRRKLRGRYARLSVQCRAEAAQPRSPISKRRRKRFTGAGSSTATAT